MFRCIYLLSILSLLGQIQGQEHEQEQLCPCEFDVAPEEEASCRVYGQLGGDDRTLIPWYRATQECLDLYNIKVQAVDPRDIEAVCRNGNPDLAQLRTFLRFNSGPASKAFKTQYTEIFDSTSSNIKDQIMTSTGTLDCQANVNNCWNYLPTFFADKIDEVVTFCQELVNRRAFELETEQSVVRIRLCQEGLEPVCSPLDVQVDEIKGNATSCAALGLGTNAVGVRPPTNPCSNDDNDNINGTDTPDGAIWRGTLVWLIPLGWILAMR